MVGRSVGRQRAFYARRAIERYETTMTDHRKDDDECPAKVHEVCQWTRTFGENFPAISLVVRCFGFAHSFSFTGEIRPICSWILLLLLLLHRLHHHRATLSTVRWSLVAAKLKNANWPKAHPDDHSLLTILNE